jgi:hypothetical protein
MLELNKETNLLETNSFNQPTYMASIESANKVVHIRNKTSCIGDWKEATNRCFKPNKKHQTMKRLDAQTLEMHSTNNIKRNRT